MSVRNEPEYELGADPKTGTTWNIYRGSDAYLNLAIRLPDVGAPVLSTDTVAAVYAHIRQAKSDATPKIILGNTGGRTGATVTRPEPNLLLIEFHITDTQTTEDLDLLSVQDTPTRRRQEVPGDGAFDVLVELSGGDKHFVFKSAVKAEQMVTRLADE